MEKRFKVALSFPGEYRCFVSQVADLLASHLGKDCILYDKYFEAEFARPDLDVYLQSLYHDNADLLVVFLCLEYEKKEWCGLEWRAVRDLLMKKQHSRIMLMRFDNTKIQGVFAIDGYIDATKYTPAELGILILQRLRLNSDNVETPIGGSHSSLNEFRVKVVGKKRSTVAKFAMKTIFFPNDWELLELDADPEKIKLTFGDGSIREIYPGQFVTEINRLMYPSFGRFVTVTTTEGRKFRFLERLVQYNQDEFEIIMEVLMPNESPMSRVSPILYNFMRVLELIQKIKR